MKKTPLLQGPVFYSHRGLSHEMQFVCDCHFWCHQDQCNYRVRYPSVYLVLIYTEDLSYCYKLLCAGSVVLVCNGYLLAGTVCVCVCVCVLFETRASHVIPLICELVI